MAAEDRILKILLQLKADTADAPKVIAALKGIETQAIETSGAIGRVTTGAAGQTITDTNAPSTTLSPEDAKIEADYHAYLEKNFALRQASNATQAQGIALTEEDAVAEAKKSLQMERQVIVELQLEAAEAKIAGNPALAAKLEREADIRFRALTIQRAMNVSTEEAIVLAERLVLAEEAQLAPTALAGANLNKAKGEAIVLAREIATGSVNARTMGALLGSLGTTLTIAGLAGYELFNIITSIADESLRLATEYEKQTNELDKQVRHWLALSKAAGNLGDVVKIADAIAPALQRGVEKLRELQTEQIGLLKTFSDWATQPLLQSIDNPATGHFAQVQKDRIALQEEFDQKWLTTANVAVEAGAAAAAQWQLVKIEPLSQAIGDYTQRVKELKAEQAGIDRTKDIGSFEEWRRVTGELSLATDRLGELNKSQEKLNDQTDKLGDKVRAADLGKLDDSGKLTEFAAQITDIHEGLAKLGIDAPTPAAVIEALEKQKTLTEEQVKEVQKLVAAWLQTEAAIKQTTESQGEDARKTRSDALNASLRQQQTELQNIRQQQQLIGANPFLSPDTKQALTLASMTAETLKLNAAIEQNKQDLANSVFDDGQHERMRSQLQRDQFELDKLKLKITEINHPLGAELSAWVNSFGTAAHQIGNLIEGSINQALSATNQLIIDAAFRTGDWRQTVVGLERSLLNMFLTMLEQMALQQAASLLGITTTTTAQVASGAAITTAHAPAAAATSISSYGVAALIGEIAAIAAIVAIMAALGGAFRKGGYTGEGDADEPAGLVHKGEYVMPKEVTETHGVPAMRALHRGEASIVPDSELGAPHFYDGGRVGQYPPPTPPYLGGYITTPDGSVYRYGSGGARGSRGSIPFGDYPITPGALGPWGQTHNAVGINNGMIWDPTIGDYREGIQIHSGSSDYLRSLGCVAVDPADYASVREAALVPGARMTVSPDGNISIYYPDQTSPALVTHEAMDMPGTPAGHFDEPAALPGADESEVGSGNVAGAGYNITLDPSFFPNVFPGETDVNAPPISQTLPATPPYRSPGAGDIRSFGLPPIAGPGQPFLPYQYYYTPLGDLQYGEGYPVSGGDITAAGVTQHVPGEPGAIGGPPPTSGEVQIDPETGEPYDLGSIPTATVSPISPGGSRREPGGGFGSLADLLNPAPAGMTIIGHDFVNGQPIYRDAQGNLFVNPGTGSPLQQFDYGSGEFRPFNTGGPQSAGDSKNQGEFYAGGTNYMGNTGDEGHTEFHPGEIGSTHGFIDAEGNLQIVRNTPESIQAWHDMLIRSGHTHMPSREEVMAALGGGGIIDPRLVYGSPDERMSALQAPSGSGGDESQGSTGGGGTSVPFSAPIGIPPVGGAYPFTLPVHRGGFAEGGRFPGLPSEKDNMWAQVATGEHVIQSRAVQWADSMFGPDFLDKINSMELAMPAHHFAEGGRVLSMPGGASSSSQSSSRSGGGGQAPVKIVVMTDWKAALREARKDRDHRVFIVDTIKGAAHEIGIGAVNG